MPSNLIFSIVRQSLSFHTFICGSYIQFKCQKLIFEWLKLFLSAELGKGIKFYCTCEKTYSISCRSMTIQAIKISFHIPKVQQVSSYIKNCHFKLSDFATEIRYLNLYLKQLYKHALEILQFQVKFIVSQKLIVATIPFQVLK